MQGEKQVVGNPGRDITQYYGRHDDNAGYGTKRRKWNMLFKLGNYSVKHALQTILKTLFLLAGRTEAGKLKQVVIYSEARLTGDVLHHFLQPAVGNGNHPLAVGANQMMMMLRCAHRVTTAAMAGMKLTKEPQSVQYIQSAVNRYQSNTRVLLLNPVIYGQRGQMVRAGGNYLYHRPPLRGELITLPPQFGNSSSFVKSHIRYN